MKITESWLLNYRLLEEYYEIYKNIDVPSRYVTDKGVKLGKWLARQRQIYNGNISGTLSKKQIMLLEKLGIKWSKRVGDWNEYYHNLKDYYEKHGNSDVPKRYVTDNGIKLGQWVLRQRQLYNGNISGKLSKEQIRLLEILDIKWNKRADDWDEYYYHLENYYKKYGNIDVPIRYVTEDGVKLGFWLRNQKVNHNLGRNSGLREDQIILLNDLEIKWNVRQKTWDKYYQALIKYYEENGNVDVNSRYKTADNLNLGKWLSHQRQAYKEQNISKLNHLRIKYLNSLNVDWSVHDTKLLKMKIVKENKDKYYSVLNNRLNHVLNDLSYEVGNQITKENQEELCKQIVKRVWR